MIEEKELRVTTPQEYEQIAKGRSELVRLPTGLVVRARRVKMEGMALKGGLPVSLLRAAGSIKMVSQNPEDSTPEQIEETQNALIFLRELTRKNCLEPLIVYDDERVVVWQWPDGTRLEIDDEDFDYLAAWVRGEEVDEIDSFRKRTDGSSSSTQPDSETLQPESVAVTEGQPA